MKRFGIVLLVVLISVFCMVNLSGAETDITFAWNMLNPPADLAGFKMFQREGIGSYDYANPVATINDPNARECQLTGVADGKNLYWVVRAFDSDGLDSPDSNEVSQDKTGPPGAPGGLNIQSIVNVNVNFNVTP